MLSLNTMILSPRTCMCNVAGCRHTVSGSMMLQEQLDAASRLMQWFVMRC